MKLYLAAILAVAFVENFNVHIIKETLGSQTMALSSCVDLQTEEINIRRISDYEVQSRPVKAVILITRSGVKVCVPRDLPWVKRIVQRVDQKKIRKQKKITTRPNAAAS